ncbi:MAG: hypothetical protein AAGK32_17195 [Actinomycetota bacterium]
MPRLTLPVKLAAVGLIGLGVRVVSVMTHYRDLPLGLDDNNW